MKTQYMIKMTSLKSEGKEIYVLAQDYWLSECAWGGGRDRAKKFR